MPVIMESPNHHSMFFNKRPLLPPYRIAFRHSLGLIQMGVESRLMRDHQIQAEVSRRRPNVDEVRYSGSKEALERMIRSWFDPGSGPGREELDEMLRGIEAAS